MSRLSEFIVGFRHLGQDLRVSGISKCHFTKSEWEEFQEPVAQSSWKYLAWRGFYLLFFAVTLSWSLKTTSHGVLYPIYLTRWCLFSQLLYSLLFFANNLFQTISSTRKSQKQDLKKISDSPHDGVAPSNGVHLMEDAELALHGELHRLECLGGNKGSTTVASTYHSIQVSNATKVSFNSKLESLIWILHGIQVTLPLFVFVGYWSVVFRSERPHLSSEGLAVSCMAHGLNTILALLDLLIVAIPFRVTHALFSILLGITYALFTGLYEVAGGPYARAGEPFIYSMLNWRKKPKWAFVASLMSILALFILYQLLWLVYVLRLKLVSRFSSRRDRDRIYSIHQYYSSSSDLNK